LKLERAMGIEPSFSIPQGCQEKNPANCCLGKLTAPGNAFVTAWENRIEEIRNVVNGIKT
jgi:hypothetical protein